MNESIGTNIMLLRKERGMTQEQLANALGITFQAVSKWENGVSSPDISTLPLLADLFSVTIDQLMGRQELPEPVFASAAEPEPELTPEPVFASAAEPEPELTPEPDPEPERQPEEAPANVLPAPEDALPWPDDEGYYAVLYRGHKRINHAAVIEEMRTVKDRVVLEIKGSANNVSSAFAVRVSGTVYGDVRAGENVICGDVSGNLEASGSVSCGDVDGNVRAGGNIACGDVDGDATAGGNINCDDVDGDVRAGGVVSCDNVDGSITAGVSVRSEDNGTEEGFDRKLNEMIDRQIEHSIRLSMTPLLENEDLRDPDEEETEETFQFRFDGEDFGEMLGRTISQAVQKAMDFGNKFRFKGREDRTGSADKE